jgi:hypothetical protein
MSVIRARDEPDAPHDPNGLVIESLRMSAPSFAAPWRELASDWLPEDVPSYVAAGAFATHLVRLLEADKIDEFPAVFSAIERLLVEGDPGIRYVVTWGLLEDLGNVAANQQGWPFARRFREWFGPVSTTAWDEIHRRWGTSRHDPPTRDIPRR